MIRALHEWNTPLRHRLLQGVKNLDQTYPIWEDDVIVGQAQVSKQGLYYRIYCECKRQKDGGLRAHVQCGNRRADLGILVPEGNRYTTNTRIAISKLGEGDLCFYAQPMRVDASKALVSISPDQPFDSLPQLENIRLRRKNGCLYAQIIDI